MTALFRKDTLHDEFHAEMEQHLDFMIDDLTRQGMSREEARKEALKQFGNVEFLKEDCQASWGIRIWDDFVNDFRFAIRQLFKHKVHTAIIVLTLAICMGSNTTAYNLVVKLVSKPYDYADADQVVLVGKKWPKLQGDSIGQVSIPHYAFLEENTESFSSIGFVADGNFFDLDLNNSTRRVATDKITAGVWDVTGVRPVAGRFFSQEDVEQSSGKVAVLSEALWRELGGEDAQIVGEQLRLDGESYQVIGIAPESFYLRYERADVWVPRVFKPWEFQPDQRNNHSFSVVAKLKSGVSHDQANQRLRSLYESFLEIHPGDRLEQERTGATFGSVDINVSLTQGLEQIGMAFRSIQFVTLVVLVIGCLNVGGMILLKGYARIQELAMRKAMGASVFRLARQVYVEIVVYFLLGGAFSILVLKAAFQGSQLVQIDDIPWAGEWAIDANSLLVTAAIALGAALLTGVMPLVSLLRRELMEFIKSGNRSMTGSKSKHRLQSAFVISQVSLSVILLIMAGVLIRNLNAVLQKDVGFDREGRIAFEVPHPKYRFGEGEEDYRAKVLTFQERALLSICSIPGVINASTTNRIPIDVRHMNHSSFSMSHYEYEEGEPEATALRLVTRPGYFDTVGTRLILGRDFQETDTHQTERVVIISQNTMERYYQGMDPVGLSISIWGKDMKIVGVAEQVQDKPFFMEFDQYTIYFPAKQWHDLSNGQTTFVVHTQGDSEQQLASIEKAILEVDPKVTIDSITFDDVYKGATFTQRLPMIMTALFAGLALLLSSLGLYGLISFTVTERTKEFGIRMALGAGRRNILKRVMGGSSWLIGCGLTVGLVVSFLVCSQLNPVFSDVNTTNPVTFVGVIVFVLAICLFATVFPAHRATRINITRTLQY